MAVSVNWSPFDRKLAPAAARPATASARRAAELLCTHARGLAAEVGSVRPYGLHDPLKGCMVQVTD